VGLAKLFATACAVVFSGVTVHPTLLPVWVPPAEFYVHPVDSAEVSLSYDSFPACDFDRVEDVMRVAELAESAGFVGDDLVVAVAVAFAESDGVVDAVNVNGNGSVDRGLWQINSVHGFSGLFDGAVNAGAAFDVWVGQGWSAWYAHTPRGQGYGSGVRFNYWLPLVECVVDWGG